MPKTRQQKEASVTKIADNLAKSKSVVFADYQQAGISGSKGMTMSQLSTLRKSLKEVGAELIITKNNLLKIALQSTNYLPVRQAGQLPARPAGGPTTNLFDGPIATLFAYEDEITPMRILTKALKDNGVGRIKAGFFEGEYIDDIKINKLASLPSKDELRAKIVGSLGAPLYGIVGVLQANLRNLVYALEQFRISKGGE